MKKKIVLISFIFAIVILSIVNPVHAENLGKINFVAINNTNSEPVEGLEVSVYQVSSQDTNGNFILEEDFENCNIDINDLSEENLENLKNFAKENAETVFTKSTNEKGKFTLENLELGTYLFVQQNQTETIIMQTMIITIPELTTENGLKYEITVKPKINEVAHGGEDIPLEDELPSTGTLDWIVPILAIAGLVIFCIAWLKAYTTSKKKSKLAIFSMIFSVVLLVSAGGLLIYNTNESKRVEETNLETVTKLEKMYEQPLLEIESESKKEEFKEKKESISIDGYNYIGVIYIPSLDNLAIPVLETYTPDNLKVSVCKYSGGIEEGNFTIAGHNYKSSFGKLSKLSIRKYCLF